MRSRVFISMMGPNGNLGDIFIRREVLNWARDPSGVVAFVGNHPASWIGAMGFRAEDELVRGGTLHRMLWLMRCALGRRRPILVTDPGETWVRADRRIHHLVHLAAGLLIKARGGRIIIPPHALAQHKAASVSNSTLAIHVAFAKLADLCLWREPWSHERAGCGDLVPDIALAAPPRLEGSEAGGRFCVVSFRGDRPPVSREVVDAISRHASRYDLEIVSLSQVDADRPGAEMLGAKLNARCVLWDSEDPASESRVRAVYDSAALVVSDRLHVLMLGLLAGAMPAELVVAPERKISAHFETIGLDGISLDAAGSSAAEMADWLSIQMSRQAEAVSAVQLAHRRLEVVGAKVRSITA